MRDIFRSLFLRGQSPQNRSLRKSRKRTRKPQVERLESRQLMAIEVVQQDFMTVTYQMLDNSFGGVDRYDLPNKPDYAANSAATMPNSTRPLPSFGKSTRPRNAKSSGRVRLKRCSGRVNLRRSLRT